MRRTGLLLDERFLLHETGPYHPEVPERILAIFKGIKDADLLQHLTLFKAEAADLEWIEAVHDKDYIARFSDACFSGMKTFEHPDNQMCMESYDTALLAAGGVLSAVDRIMQDELDNCFCAVRPPGHHAERNRAMGFCYFNNVAVAARYLQVKWQIAKCCIIDFDVHHGNGTQAIFEQDPTVYYYSIHQHPSFAYPGTGRDFETGSGKGHGFTRNDTVLPGQGDDEYRDLVDNHMLSAVDEFKPDFILVSTGFDAHADDDMSDMKLSSECYRWIMQKIMELADRHCGGRLISVLEGGYALHRLGELGADHVQVMLND